MGKKFMNKKKTILTEDLFNANGNANVSTEILTEEKVNTISDENVIINDKHDEENEELNNDLKNDEMIENSIQENEEMATTDINTLSEELSSDLKNDEAEVLEENEEIAKVVKPIKSIKKIGFSDESYYFNDLK